MIMNLQTRARQRHRLKTGLVSSFKTCGLTTTDVDGIQKSKSVHEIWILVKGHIDI